MFRSSAFKALFAVILLSPAISQGQTCDPQATCSGNGSCNPDGTCICDTGWQGTDCSLPICVQACINGTCVGPDTCACDPGWFGRICSYPICTPNCVFGFCNAPDFCVCVSGWTGALCDVPSCDPICVFGTCVEPDLCECEIGWTGNTCEFDIDECADNPCDTNAACTNLPGNFTCECSPGYTGSGAPGDCLDIDECANNPCPLNATCTNLPGSVTCECNNGWTGLNCDIPVCSPTCVNGTCISPGQCECDPGWTAPDCSLPDAIQAPMDIKPDSCPNLFKLPPNTRGNGPGTANGNLSAVLVGTPVFDISLVDPASLRLTRADGSGTFVEPMNGPPGPHPVMDDISAPFNGRDCECHIAQGDGVPDLHLLLRRAELVVNLQLGDLPPGTEVKLVLSGLLLDGTPIVAQDCLTLR